MLYKFFCQSSSSSLSMAFKEKYLNRACVVEYLVPPVIHKDAKNKFVTFQVLYSVNFIYIYINLISDGPLVHYLILRFFK